MAATLLLVSGCGLMPARQAPSVQGGSGVSGSQPPGGIGTLSSALQPNEATAEDLGESAPFEIVQTELVGSPDRVRYQTDILVAPDLSREELISALTDAVRMTLDAQPNAQAVVAFAFTRAEAVGKIFETGRALASRDGHGWRGENSWFPFVRLPDLSKIHITLGSALTQVEEIEVDPGFSDRSPASTV